MEGVKRLFEQSKRFYLVILILVLFCSSLDCWYISSNYLSRLNSLEYIEELVQNTDALQAFSNNKISLGEIFVNRLVDLNAIYIIFVMIGIFAILLIRGFAFMDERTKEFRLMWPVKGWLRELYDYVSVFLIIGIGYLFQLFVLLMVQIHSNNRLQELLHLDGENAVVSEMIKTSNTTLVNSVLYCVFSVLLLYTWIYFCMTITRNPMVGIVVALFVYQSFYVLCDTWIWEIDYRFSENYLQNNMNSYEPWFYVYRILWFCCSLLSDYWASCCYNPSERSFVETYIEVFDSYDIQICSLERWMLCKIVVFVILILGIVWTTRKKNFEQGKIFCFAQFDYLSSIYVGILFTEIAATAFLPINISNVTAYDVFATVLVGVIAMMLMFFIVHPRKKKKHLCLEVK